MNVQQLIDKLNEVEDKTQEVYYYNKYWDHEHDIIEPIETLTKNTYKYNTNGELKGICLHVDYEIPY